MSREERKLKLVMEQFAKLEEAEEARAEKKSAGKKRMRSTVSGVAKRTVAKGKEETSESEENSSEKSSVSKPNVNTNLPSPKATPVVSPNANSGDSENWRMGKKAWLLKAATPKGQPVARFLLLCGYCCFNASHVVYHGKRSGGWRQLHRLQFSPEIVMV